MKKSGFTLIELLVVIALMGILSIIFSDTLTQILRGQSKVRIINQVKQNGQQVLDKLSNEIRSSEKVICVGHNIGNTISTYNDTLVVFKQGMYTQFRLYPPTDSTNGRIIRDDFISDQIPDGRLEAEYCSINVSTGEISNLTDVSTASGVSVSYDGNNDIFSPSSLSGFDDNISIRFRISAGVNAPSTFENQVGSSGVLFNTTVQVRGGR